MNLLHILQPSRHLTAVHARLGERLVSTQHTSATPADDADDTPLAEPLAADFAVPMTTTRTYRPKGKTLAVLIALRAGGPMTAAALATVASCPAKQIWRFLEIPVANGLVKRIEGRPVLWALA